MIALRSFLFLLSSSFLRYLVACFFVGVIPPLNLSSNSSMLKFGSFKSSSACLNLSSGINRVLLFGKMTYKYLILFRLV